ncbi:MAG: riboflavin synthase [Parvularculaceae bacterium]
MFTGLIEELGTVAAVTRAAGGYQLTITARTFLDGLMLGDSIAVDGVCLTATAFDDRSFTVGLAPETLAKTSLGDRIVGDAVALERAALPTTRLGGHYVQGHIDATGVIKSFRPDKDALWLAIAAAPALMRYIVPKGYIAIDGASLTVVNTGADWFDVTLVAYSQEKLVLPRKKPGARVNLEVDILAKYVERLFAQSVDPSPLLRGPAAPHPEALAKRASKDGGRAPQDEAKDSPLSKQFLAAHGFLKEGAR